MTQADQILAECFNDLGIAELSDAQKYQRLEQIIVELARRNQAKRINVGTTGTISERLCELAIKTVFDGDYSSLPRDWKWLGDFSIVGLPFNVLVSVKSFKAKERLLASGSGGILTPTIGWGLFDDPKEWGENRTKAYLYRSFIAVYMPGSTHEKVAPASRQILNLNGKPFLRPISQFITDLQAAKVKNRIDMRLL